jgi:hypothetical protein
VTSNNKSRLPAATVKLKDEFWTVIYQGTCRIQKPLMEMDPTVRREMEDVG